MGGAAPRPLAVTGRSYPTRERVIGLPGGLFVTCLEVMDVDLVLEDAIRGGAPAPYGAVLWASAVALAEALVERSSLAGQRVIDVGAGTGLCSLVAARLGADVIALDHDPVARELLADAARRQSLTISVRDFDVLGEEPLPAGDLVLLADLLYEEPLAEAAGRRAHEAVLRGSDVIVADPQRSGRPAFVGALAARGVAVSFEERLARVPGEEHEHRVGVASLRGVTS